MINSETNDILEEILKWQKFYAAILLRKIVLEQKLFNDKKETAIYNESDGEKSSRDLEKITGVNYKRIIGLWKSWVNAGIAERTDKYKGGRVRRIFTLDELGINN